MLVVGLAGCKTLKLPELGSRSLGKAPGSENGFLAAKAVAFRHAMENMPAENKRFGDEFYIASGIHDADATHAKFLIAALNDMHPPVVSASSLYSRAEDSKWMDGKPAIAWTSKVERITKDKHVVVQVGWMHSNLIHEFFEYETRYTKKDDSWDVVDYKVIEAPGTAVIEDPGAVLDHPGS